MANKSVRFEESCGKNPKFISTFVEESVVSHHQAFCMQLIGECLVTHCELTPADIIWALEYDFTTLSNEQLATIVVHICKTTDIGKFSLCFNFTIDVTLIKRDKTQWASLLNIDHKDAFPEFYNQLSEFTVGERKTLESTHTLEYNAAYQLVTSMHKVDFPLRQYLIRKCPTIKDKVKIKILDGNDVNTTELSKAVEMMSSPFSQGGVTVDGKKNVTIYKQCYDKVCLMEKININLRAELEDDILIVPDVKYISAGESEFRMTFVHCMKVLTLVKSLSLDKITVIDELAGRKYTTAINPGSGKPFNIAIYEMLRKRMATEIKLYSYFANSCEKCANC